MNYSECYDYYKILAFDLVIQFVIFLLKTIGLIFQANTISFDLTDPVKFHTNLVSFVILILTCVLQIGLLFKPDQYITWVTCRTTLYTAIRHLFAELKAQIQKLPARETLRDVNLLDPDLEHKFQVVNQIYNALDLLVGRFRCVILCSTIVNICCIVIWTTDPQPKIINDVLGFHIAAVAISISYTAYSVLSGSNRGFLQLEYPIIVIARKTEHIPQPESMVYLSSIPKPPNEPPPDVQSYISEPIPFIPYPIQEFDPYEDIPQE